jgi:hypothetical protein
MAKPRKDGESQGEPKRKQRKPRKGRDMTEATELQPAPQPIPDAPPTPPRGRGRPPKGSDTHMGRIIAQALWTMGYVNPPKPATLKVAEAARDIAERTGRNMDRRRLGQIIDAERVEPETLEWLAEGLGLTVAELVSGKIPEDKRVKDDPE